MKTQNLRGLRKPLAYLACGLFATVGAYGSEFRFASSEGQNVSKAALPKDKKVEQPSTPTVAPTPDVNPQPLPTVDPKTYKIGVEDDLMVSVWREPELSTQVVVRPDGKITLPLINDLDVVGLRTEELKNSNRL